MNEPRVLIDDDDRYARLKLIGWWDQPRLMAARILVVGAGALGNEVLKNLALLGIGHITIIDFDTVEDSNLSRSILFRASDRGELKVNVARRAIRDINPDVAVDPIAGNVLTDVGLGLVRDVDIVIGCLDNREARLWLNRMCWKVETPWIDGGIQEINGVAKVFIPPDGACYECAMTDLDYQLIQLRYSCPLLKREDMQQGKVPTAPTIASIVGGLQVQEALKLLHGIPTSEGAALVFNGAANQFYTSKFQHRPDCMSHETYENIIELNASADQSLADVAGLLRQEHQLVVEKLELDRDLVVQLHCGQCDQSREILQPLPTLHAQDGHCPSCAQPMMPQMIHAIETEHDFAEKPLRQLGIPDRDILHLRSSADSFFVQLQTFRQTS